MQHGLLAARYPHSQIRRTRVAVTATVTLTPSAHSDTYEVLLDHQPPASPLVYVVRPRLQSAGGRPLPHVYSHNTLCLYHGEQEWSASRSLVNLVEWASEWLFYYEIWLATAGQWLGRGAHPNPQGQGAARSTRRYELRQRPRRATGPSNGADPTEEARLKRLTHALRRMYPRQVALEDLLENTQPPTNTAPRTRR